MEDRELSRLARELEHPHWDVRLKAVEALATSPHAEAIELISTVLYDDNTAVIQAAALALIQSRSELAFEPLMRAFDGDDVEVGEEVQDVLANHPEPWLVEACIEAVRKSADPGVREAAARALGYPFCEKTAIDALRAALVDPEDDVREVAADSLDRITARWKI